MGMSKLRRQVKIELVNEQSGKPVCSCGARAAPMHELLRHARGGGSKYQTSDELYMNRYTTILVCTRCNLTRMNSMPLQEQVDMRKAQIPDDERWKVDHAISTFAATLRQPSAWIDAKWIVDDPAIWIGGKDG